MSMRKYQRAIAHKKMELDGIERINKKMPIIDRNGKVAGFTSFFASHWRIYCDMPLSKIMKPKRKHGKRHGRFLDRRALT